MSGADNGWIKLHRRFLRSAIWQNPNVARFWTWCLLKATHDGYTTTIGYRKVTLEPGQLLYNHPMASIETGLSQKIVRMCLEMLKNGDDPEIGQAKGSLPGNRFSIVTIRKWADYQMHDDGEGRRGTGKRAGKGQAQGSLINNEGKNVEKQPAQSPGESDGPECEFSPSKQQREAAQKVITAFEEKVKPRRIDDKMKRVDQRRRLFDLFAEGRTEEEMHRAIDAFAAHWLKEDGGVPEKLQYRFGFRRFFGERENLWASYLESASVAAASGGLAELDYWSDRAKDAFGMEWTQRFRAKALELKDVDKARDWLKAERAKGAGCA